ncbi:hypothetical protein KAI32_02965 [Candidatus Pacearchaeota archaeon]|nr:hypothetical protein [Candidatus Pacearchaeota archaeon]
MKKALLLYSDGLDSRLVVHLLQEQGYTVEALYFALPFESKRITPKKTNNLNLTIIDITKEPLLSEYLSILKKPKFGTGAGINPCIDCKIFMLKKAKEYADKHGYDIIATGEVPGQRPMSQTNSAQTKIDAEIKFKIIRPLADAGFSGRSRKKQIELAKKYKIKYPNPAGGCFLCEKEPSTRLKTLLKKDLINEKTLILTMIGRHFFIDDIWFVVARDETESRLITKFKTSIKDVKGKPSIYYNNEKGKQKALELQEAYSTGTSKEERDKFEKVKL